ncbi:Nucleolar protein 10 [Astathelohania contejeani]|uniref:Nucleolar protein 10 n=1 Tax=Astathelohania contejeani TaxID=164912 RepID=A0ABQ7I2C3_9MICR|nr:Nucleolar protein 10 [Thelohania contejeani]
MNSIEYKEISLIQDMEYTATCNHIKLTEDGTHLISCGSYRPQIKIHELKELAMKLERHMDSEPIRLEILDTNHHKLAILRDDRTIEFHAKYGVHHKIRVPSLGNDLCLNKLKADLLICGYSNEIYRFNLQQGRFIKSYTTSLKKINSIKINPIHNLIGYVGDSKIEFIDPRNKNIIASIEMQFHELTKMAYSGNGINFCIGGSDNTNKNKVQMFDLRSKNPIKQNLHDTKISDVLFNGKNIISADRNNIKIWNSEEYALDIQTDGIINTLEVDKGILFVGYEGGPIKTYYSSILGGIPEWVECKSNLL